VTSIAQTLMNNTPLDGCEVIVIHGDILFPTPSKTAMINDNIRGILDTNSATINKTALLISLIAFTSFLRTEYLNDIIASMDSEAL